MSPATLLSKCVARRALSGTGILLSGMTSRIFDWLQDLFPVTLLQLRLSTGSLHVPVVRVNHSEFALEEWRKKCKDPELALKAKTAFLVICGRHNLVDSPLTMSLIGSRYKGSVAFQ